MWTTFSNWTAMWIIIFFALGIGLTLLFGWLRSRQITVNWWEWLLGALGLLALLMAIQNFVTSFAELESDAAWLMLATFGVPALILLGIPASRIWRRFRAT